MAGKKGKSGRHSTKDKLTPESIAAAAAAAEELAKQNLTDAQIAERFNISPSTICRWKEKYPIFYQSLKRSKANSDDAVEISLFDRACGYSHPAEEIKIQADGTIVRAETIKHYPPDPTSMIFWLKNRRKEQWRDRHELTGADGGPVEVALVERLNKAIERISQKKS